MSTAGAAGAGSHRARGAASVVVFLSADGPSMFAGRTAQLARLAAMTDRVGLVLLSVVIGTLLFRPADLFPALAGDPIYEVCIVGCLVASLPRVFRQLSLRSLRANAITAMALLLVPAVILSHLSRADTWDARIGGVEAAKACLLFLLVVGLVDSAAKLRIMLLAAAGSVLVMSILALLEYHGLVNLPALASVAQRSADPEDPVLVNRLCGTGVFNDPNDFSLILVMAMSVGAYALGEFRSRRVRWLVVGALLVLGYALILTHSRGGLMAAVAGCLVFLWARFGWPSALPLSGLVAILVLAPFWGRQNTLNLGDPEDTFQTRLGLWSDSLDAFRSGPLLGVGQGNLVAAIGQVAHNSFLQAFAEMGVFGGTAFIGAFYLLLRGLWRASPGEPGLARLRPFILAITAGYAAGLLTLSRCYTVPTQLILGLGTAYLGIALGNGRADVARLDGACMRRVSGVAAVFLAATYVFVRLTIRRG